jgi:hypothetical protein
MINITQLRMFSLVFGDLVRGQLELFLYDAKTTLINPVKSETQTNKKTYPSGDNLLLQLRQPPILQFCHLLNPLRQLLLLRSHMRPRKLFFQFLRLVTLIPRFRRLLEARRDFFESGFEVGDGFALLGEDFGRLGDVLETGIIFVAELA